MLGQEQGREGGELPPWELCHPLQTLSVCEITQGVVGSAGATPAAFCVSDSIQASCPFGTVHLVRKMKSSKGSAFCD